MLGINIGIDLGTTTTIIYVQGKGIVLSEPSVAACDAKTGKMLATGNKAYDMLGRNPDSVRVVRPMKDGVVSDFTVIQSMLIYYIQKICGNKIFKPNVILCTPSSVTELEKRTILDLATASGAGRACLIEEPLAAAIGAGLDISHPCGTLVVDIGGGTTDIAVITMGSIAISKSIKVAGNALDEAIIRHMRRERNLLIGEVTAEDIKKRIGCSYLRDEELAVGVKGKNYITGMPAFFEISSTEVYLAMREQIETVGDAVHSVLEITPPEMAADIADRGIYVTGGGALLRGVDIMINRKTGIATTVADDPVNCVAKGIGKALKDINILYDNGYIFKTREEITGYEE